MLTTGDIQSRTIWHLKREDDPIYDGDNFFYRMGQCLCEGECTDEFNDVVEGWIYHFFNKIKDEDIVADGEEYDRDSSLPISERADVCKEGLLRDIRGDIWVEAEEYFKRIAEKRGEY